MPAGSLCVTRRGVVVRADGAYVIGEPGESGVLADERARRELPRRLQSVGQRLKALAEERRAEVERLEALKTRLTTIDRRMSRAREQEREDLRQRMSEARTAVAVARETLRSQRSAVEREAAELERIKGRQAALEKQALDLQERYRAEVQRARAIRLALDGPLAGEEGGEEETDTDRIPEAAEGFRRQLEEAHQRSRRLVRRQETASERIEALEDRVERVTREAAEARESAARFERETLSDARTGVAVMEASLSSERQTLERESALLERLRSQVDARRERAVELKEQREDLLTRIAQLREDAERLDTDLRAVRERIQPAEEALEELEGEQASLEERRQQAQQRVREAEERHGRAKLDVERRRDDLELLAERIEEDLGLVELELAESVTAQSPLPMRPLVSELPVVEELPEGLKGEMQFVKKRLRRLGAINPNAPAELAEVRERYEFLTEQAADLEVATGKLRQSVAELDSMMERAFQETFEAVAAQFSEMFHHLFRGGEARLTLTEPEDLLHTGVDIVARPPGKRAQRLALLSGGERALTAVALLFSLLHVSPTPFCVLDEVDAMLDEANVGRFRAKLEDLADPTQFIVITHNRNTVESADAVYGVSMGSNAVSQVVSLKLEEVRSAA
jgi:chromosome segregation protein